MESPVVMGTRAHQLAMYAVYQAAIQMVSDWPKVVRRRTGIRIHQSRSGDLG